MLKLREIYENKMITKNGGETSVKQKANSSDNKQSKSYSGEMIVDCGRNIDICEELIGIIKFFLCARTI